MKSRNFSPVGKMGAGRPMSRGTRARSQTAPRASTPSRPLTSKMKSAIQAYKNSASNFAKAMPVSSRRKKSAGAVTRPSMAKGGLNPRARMAQMRRSGRI